MQEPVKSMEAVAVVHIHEDGHVDYLIAGDETYRLFIVDERAPNDRVYEMTARASGAEIAKIFAGSPIGHAGDSRHEAIKSRVLAAAEGKPHLTVVSDNKGPSR